MTILTTFFISLLIFPSCICKLKHYQIGQNIRDDGPQSHLNKTGTPTMGGILIILMILIGTLLWANLSNNFIWIILITTLGFSFIGFIDDLKKFTMKNSVGLKPCYKFLLQSICGVIVSLVIFIFIDNHTVQVYIPFLKCIKYNLGMLYIPLIYFSVVGMSNAVNLTDGLDGLAIFPVIILSCTLGLFSYISGNNTVANFLSVPYVPYNYEVAIFCSAIIGAGLGFLWYNAYPSQIFMGDVGSLGLGAALGIIPIIVKQEIISVIISGIFVLETLSVILQVISFKFKKKRLFKMVPIHHHFELMGYDEPKIIVRFWIISIILALIGVSLFFYNFV